MAHPSFIELPAADIGAAKQFYSNAFGWALTDFTELRLHHDRRYRRGLAR